MGANGSWQCDCPLCFALRTGGEVIESTGIPDGEPPHVPREKLFSEARWALSDPTAPRQGPVDFIYCGTVKTDGSFEHSTFSVHRDGRIVWT